MARYETVLFAALALVAPACGGNTDTAPQAGGQGGTAGTATGGSSGAMTGGVGGAPIGGGGALGGNGGNCASCPTYEALGSLSLPGCCAADGHCGSSFDGNTAPAFALAPGCYAASQAGVPDSMCPPFQYTNPVTQQKTEYPGCCRAATQTCAYIVDLSLVQGPNLGCTDIDGGAGASGQGCGSLLNCSSCVQSACATELGACTSDATCVAILGCAQSCQDSTCVDQCVAAHSQGKASFDPLRACTKAKCQACNW